MKSSSFVSKDEFFEQSNAIKRKQQRLNQVRQQSKQMSSAILERIKEEAKKQCEEIENQVLAEIRNYHLKELESRRQQYEKCITDINRQHYLKQIDLSGPKSSICNEQKSLNSTKVEIVGHANSECRQKENKLRPEDTVELPEKNSILFTGRERSGRRKMNTIIPCPKKLPQNIVTDSDDERIIKNKKVSSCPTFSARSPEIKHLKSLHCVKASNLSDHKIKTSCNEEVYNHLVHDRIRILEQKDKILSRQAMFLPNASHRIKNKSPRFSEYFAHRYNVKNLTSDRNVTKENTSHFEIKMNEIMDDMKRVELKKKLLVEELKNSSENKNESNVTTSRIENDEKGVSCKSITSNVEKIQQNDSNSDKQLESSNNSVKKSQNKLCPSPIPKIPNVGSTSVEPEKRTKLPKRRYCKKIHRSNKDVVVTICNKKTRVNGASTLATQNSTSDSNTTDNNPTEHNRKSPVNIVVKVVSSADCEIKIKKNSPEKRHVRTINEKKIEKVKNWRTLFKNEEKLTESSYYSLPNHRTDIESSNEYDEKTNNSPNEHIRDVGYYVRKLLLMSPESIEKLDVSSCSTTFLDESRTVSMESNSLDYCHMQAEELNEVSSHHTTVDSRRELEATENYNTTNGSNYDSENVRQLLLGCLRLATKKENETKLPYFKSINSSCDYKSFGNHSREQDFASTNLFYTNFLNNAIQRLLPLYQNSLDDNIDVSMQSAVHDFQEIEALNKTIDSEMDVTPEEESAYVSTSAYLQKFVSSLSPSSEKRDHKEIIDYLKQYVAYSSVLDSKHLSNNTPDTTNTEHVTSSLKYDDHSGNESFVSLPSVDELVQKGLIDKSYALDELTESNKKKQFLDEEEFLKKMLEVDYSVDGRQTTVKNVQTVDEQQNAKKDNSGTSTTDIRKELRSLGLNWMDTTLQRTLQASAISSTSSAEDSAGQLRYIITSNDQSNKTKHFESSSQNSSQPKENFSISPITVPDIRLNLPDCFKKTS